MTTSLIVPLDVKVTVDRVKRVSPFLRDWFTKINIDGETWTSSHIENKKDFKPDWQFSQEVSNQEVPIQIQLWEHDDIGDHDHIDIDPRKGARNVDIKYDLPTGQITGDVSGIAGDLLKSKGGGDNRKAEIWFKVESVLNEPFYDRIINPVNGHTYFLTDPELGTSWLDAEAQAVAVGGHLVTINDAAEQEWLNQTFGTSESFWIGLNDAETERQFEWVSGEPVTYSNWASGEPNHLFSEDYVELSPSFALGQWNDRKVFASSIGGRGIVEVDPDRIINPVNGHTYFLTDPELGTSWLDAEAQAVAVGGHLVTINDAAEQEWLNQTFGTSESFWIGLNDAETERQFEWVSGEPVTYSNWASGEPNHLCSEDYVELSPSFALGQWNDRKVFASSIGGRGIIEIPNTNGVSGLDQVGTDNDILIGSMQNDSMADVDVSDDSLLSIDPNTEQLACGNYESLLIPETNPTLAAMDQESIIELETDIASDVMMSDGIVITLDDELMVDMPDIPGVDLDDSNLSIV